MRIDIVCSDEKLKEKMKAVLKKKLGDELFEN